MHGIFETSRLYGLAGCVGLGSARHHAGATRADAPLKVGFVYLGPVGDYGWTYQHDVGRKQAQAALGGEVVTSYVENVPEAPECQAVFESLASSGHDLIFGTSFGYMDYMVRGRGQISQREIRALHRL